MIKTKEDLKYYLAEDLKRYGGKNPCLLDYILHKEWMVWWKYQKLVRKFEYFENNKDNGIIYKLIWLYYYYRHRKKIYNTKSLIFPHTIGPGLKIYHLGQVMISRSAKIGKNFTCRPGCVIGDIEGVDGAAIIGDNVEFSLGVKVFGPVKIGRGALINANSVIMNNIPPYSIVSGNPGKVIGFRLNPQEILEYEKQNYKLEDRIPLSKLQKNYEKYFLNRFDEIKKQFSI